MDWLRPTFPGCEVDGSEAMLESDSRWTGFGLRSLACASYHRRVVPARELLQEECCLDALLLDSIVGIGAWGAVVDRNTLISNFVSKVCLSRSTCLHTQLTNAHLLSLRKGQITYVPYKEVDSSSKATFSAKPLASWQKTWP